MMAEKYRKMISYSAICSDASQPGAKAPWQVRDVQDTASAGSHEAPGAFGTPERILTAGLPLRRYVCRIACDVLTYTTVHFDRAAAIIHILCCAIQSTLRAFYNQSNR